ncbi:hypothetical protein BKA62DRAFT_767377 [Auriculariales sp. MPI-PUGE-AT-0066]|nr:hypothetical protein BKA62DRAFT_767377 [Auriculariales sp. MPI-PUGE-AT-0066]
MTSILPPEVWLRVFEEGVFWDERWIDIDFLREDRRNANLLSFTLVCRQWRRPAQHLLLREILIGAWDFIEEHTGELASRTDLPLTSLASTLLAWTAAGVKLAEAVQVLHVSVGLRERARGERYWNSTLDDVARLVGLCPNLRHLSLRIHGDPTGYTPVMSPTALSLFERAPKSITQLTYVDMQSAATLQRHRTITAVRAGQAMTVPDVDPDWRPLFWLIAALKNVQYLRVEASDADVTSNFAYPFNITTLRTLVANIPGQITSSSFLAHLLPSSPQLESVVLAEPRNETLQLVSPSVHSLTLLGELMEQLDFTPLRGLQHLSVQHNWLVHYTVLDDPSSILSTLPSSLYRVIIHAHEIVSPWSVKNDYETIVQAFLKLFAGRQGTISRARSYKIIAVLDKLVAPDALNNCSAWCAASNVDFIILKQQHTAIPWKEVRRPI